jgi:hypothetical protein
VATLLMATLLSAAVTATLSTGVKAAGAVAGTAVTATATAAAAAPKGDDSGKDLMGYYVDMALRAPNGQAAAQAGAAPAAPVSANNGEVTRVFGHAIATGELSEEDAQYLGSLVASRVGISQADAERRVTDAFNELKASLADAAAKAKKAADDARKASALTALWLVVSLLLGAFLASLAATFGGRLRDSAVLTQS